MTMTETEVQALVDQILASQPDPYTLAPAPYPGGLREWQDDPMEGLGGPGDEDRSPRVLRNIRVEAVATGLAMARAGTVVGVGYCLRETRELLQVGPAAPNATIGWENTTDRHRGQPQDGDPFGVPLWWTNEGPGHVALDIRRPGLCLTTDYVATGRWGVAPVDRLAAWCGGVFRGWTGDINGVTVWRRPEPWGHDERVAMVRQWLRRARENGAPQRRIDGLREWLDAMTAHDKGGK